MDQPSFQSLYLETQFGEKSLSTATGFVVENSKGAPLLITNWHVVAGRHLDTKQPLHSSAAVPDVLNIAHNQKGSLGHWVAKKESLYDESGKPLWWEHPQYGSRVDVVGLPLSEQEGIDYFPYSITGPSGHNKLPAELKWGPSDFVNVIGFPFGWTGGGALGIWVQGAIATEPDLDHEDLPRFLIDSRTRSGQSGSPVVIYKRNGWVTLQDGRPFMVHNPITLLTGVYSGRLSGDSDLGTVWKTSVVEAIAEGRSRGLRPDV